ncbi:zinc dependent phospholipase C family protein [Alkaliphilus serpentinus]|uniref:Zinc dependent phospholipase C family protein n=1 Tax=Alkaliphilus serpentinus TaxID=1482731 RepID=A0A833M5W3_9FIRM|nr:zinc dependent phospholipase C family protein [Alkaliphilus serpentinus]KAB3525508.1 zinc dependent phospholipase C family protein [Alkaliphilus serpentinus]
MMLKTHILIGQKVFDNIKELYNMKQLHRTSFIIGNIKPDIVYRLLIKSHCMKDSLYFVVNEINRLLSSEVEDIKEFSSSLGVINHFLSDFFCSAHYYQSEEFNGSINHFKYEMKLHQAFIKMERQKLLSLKELNINRYVKDSFLSSIYFLENEYKNQMPSIETDIIYALRGTTIISIFILITQL